MRHQTPTREPVLPSLRNTSAIASSYALVVMLFGMLVYRERLAKNQLLGIAMFMVGLVLLAL